MVKHLLFPTVQNSQNFLILLTSLPRRQAGDFGLLQIAYIKFEIEPFILMTVLFMLDFEIPLVSKIETLTISG